MTHFTYFVNSMVILLLIMNQAHDSSKLLIGEMSKALRCPHNLPAVIEVDNVKDMKTIW